MTDQTRLNEIRARVEAAKDSDISHECFRDHYPFVQFTEELLDLLDSLTAERDEYRRALRYLVGNEWEESAGDTLSEKAMSTVIDRQAAELAITRTQLAQREAEIEALRALLQDAVEAIEAEGLDTEYFDRRWLYLYPESPALTDKEA